MHDRPLCVRVIGESLIDVVHRNGEERRHPGGSPMNVAIGLARLGVPTELVTWLARDTDGRVIAQHLTSAGVDVHPGSFGADRTSSATAVVGADGDAEYSFDVQWRLGKVGFEGVAAWTHIGSLGTAVSPGAEQIEAALPVIARGGVLSYDPNIRPSVTPDRNAARDRFLRIAARCDVVKLSAEDADWLFPGQRPDEVLDLIEHGGSGIAVLTMGGDGVILRARGVSAIVPAVRAAVVDTVGAGDSFMSALLSELVVRGCALEHDALVHAGRRAALAAALTVSRAGAQPPTKAELDAALLERNEQ